MQRNFIERRRNRPSYLMPFLFFLLELLLMYLVFSLINWNMSLSDWSGYTYPFALIWILFSTVKLRIVLRRQRLHNE